MELFKEEIELFDHDTGKKLLSMLAKRQKTL